MRYFFLLTFSLAAHCLWAAHGGTIRGLITHAETGEALTGVTVRLEERNLFAATNEIGYFAFPDLPNGDYTLSVSYLGFAPMRQQVRIRDHETTNVRFDLTEKRITLEDVEITAHQSHPLQSISQLDIRLRPVQSSQDILRLVPGLFIAQHAGGGKAEQIFLRGFDVDHGTDVALFADGIPVNMVSHAHGQGYADLHFLIPELVQKVDFQKGLYDTRTGNFATAGQVRFETPEMLDRQFIKLEAGQFDTYRMVGALQLLEPTDRGASAYVAGEQLFSNAYFDAPQRLRRQNYFAKFRKTGDRHAVSLSASAFTSSWLASGQIPERAVRAGQIGHFGAIDSTEGGATSRYQLNAEHFWSISDKTLVKNQFYYAKYRFELYSNFTFFLEDPDNGDQIRQKENRDMTGYNGALLHQTYLMGKPLSLETGLQIRSDEILGNELSRTRNRRETLQNLALGDIQEIQTAAYAQAAFQWTRTLSVEFGARYDQFYYACQNALDSTFSTATAARRQMSPKLNIHWQAADQVQVFARIGSGFHSNDARTVLFSPDQNILPTAWGQDLGLQLRPWKPLLLGLTGWHLDLEQELVYVGDAGVVEPGGRTRRYGLDVSARWQWSRFLFFDADYTWTRARTTNAPEGAQYIPLAPVHTATAGVQWISDALSAGLRMRYLGDRPANEDYSLTAKGYLIIDAQLSWSPAFGKGKRPLECMVSVQNLGNRLWYEAQFDTESKLRGEAEPVSEIHFTPGTPFWLKAGFMWRF